MATALVFLILAIFALLLSALFFLSRIKAYWTLFCKNLSGSESDKYLSQFSLLILRDPKDMQLQSMNKYEAPNKGMFKPHIILLGLLTRKRPAVEPFQDDLILKMELPDQPMQICDTSKLLY